MKRLFIDLDICDRCAECKASCDYFFHPQNNGITSLREYATFATICRHCEEAPCVNSCYHHALERAPDNHIKRYKMRCTSCKSCSVACPFGVIFQDFLPYLDSRCDFCVGKDQELPACPAGRPACVLSCPEKAIEVKEVEESLEKEIFFVGEHLAVHSRKWSREDIQPKKK